MTIKEEKRLLRKEIRTQEQALPDEYIARASVEIGARLEALPAYQAARTIFCFVSMPREVSTRDLLAHALQSGKRVCVPLCVRMGEMELREIGSLSQLVPGAYGILEPPASAPRISAEEVDFAVIPCLSCTRSGERLGKGGGFYDRFLARYGGEAALICLERLVRDFLPMEPHDCALPRVITEAGLYECGKAVAPDGQS